MALLIYYTKKQKKKQIMYDTMNTYMYVHYILVYLYIQDKWVSPYIQTGNPWRNTGKS